MRKRVVLLVATVGIATAVALAACSPLRRFAYSGPGRDSWQQPERVVASLALETGARVADLGAGGGYFTFRLAEAVGSEGQVYAVDIDEDMVAYIEEQAGDEGYGQVRGVRAGTDDAQLPEPVDLVFTCNTYHHLQDRTAYFERLRGSLRPRGRVAVVEFRHGSWLLGSHATHPRPSRVRWPERAMRWSTGTSTWSDRASWSSLRAEPVSHGALALL